VAQNAGKSRIVVALAALVAVVVAARALHADRLLLDFVAWVRGAGAAGMVAFAVTYVVATVLFLPGLILTLGAGFAYGVAVGVPLVWVSANLGAVAAFLLGRTVLRDTIARRVEANPRFAAIDRAVAREGLKIVLLTRLSPVFPFNLLNYAYGLTRVSLRDYAIGSLVGMLPASILFVYVGSLVTNLADLSAGGSAGGGGTAQRVFFFAGLGVAGLVVAVVTRVARRALDEATRAAGGGAERGVPPPGDDAPPASGPALLPDDPHDRKHLDSVHPPRWTNPTPAGRYNLVVVGGGTAGLVSAASAAGLGAKVALVERHLLGGDCLNVGCVPSKALLGAARVAAEARDAGRFGVRVAGVEVDFPAVMARMRAIRAQLAPNDSARRFTSLGVDVFFGHGRFTSPTTVEVDDRRLEFARAVIATGARAEAPPIPGLAAAGYLTNETVFTLTDLPRRLVVIGGGPIGCELAQAFARFGAEVTVLEMEPRILPREDPDAAAMVARRMAADGVRIVCGAKVTRAEPGAVHWEKDGARAAAACDRILVGIGRAPNVEGLGLSAAGIAFTKQGVTVNDFLQTTNPRVYAAGDIASRFKFTHTADALARIVVQNALFFGRRKASALVVPWCTYTSPEVAHVGLSERDAAAQGLAVDTFTLPLHDVDRAVLDGQADGFFRVHVARGKDRIVGGTLVAEHAGDLISEVTLAMVAGKGLGSLASVIHPYPTQAEAIRKAGDAYNRTRLTPTVKRLFAWILRLRR
jgi:pyruvate/2-oxoglutarate dehydrogenase complex dihydrolipoamide dehydrogenase (E3) component/uncharacterized membrane protein YdjX (TVP38/TMEM64 family)